MSEILSIEKCGWRAHISMLGGTVRSVQTPSGRELLAMPENVDSLPPGTEIHGGIPICWPWFAQFGPVPSSRLHGIVRYQTWSVRERKSDRLVLASTDTDETMGDWPYRFSVEAEYLLTGESFSLTFRATNRGDEPFACTDGFHPYFLVERALGSTVDGVDGLRYYRNTEAGLGSNRRFSGAYVAGVSSVQFWEGSRRHVLTDAGSGRRLTIVCEGNRNLDIWVAQPEFSFGMPVPADFARHFVCVEPAMSRPDSAYVLSPGETRLLRMTVSV